MPCMYNYYQALYFIKYTDLQHLIHKVNNIPDCFESRVVDGSKERHDHVRHAWVICILKVVKNRDTVILWVLYGSLRA